MLTADDLVDFFINEIESNSKNYYSYCYNDALHFFGVPPPRIIVNDNITTSYNPRLKTINLNKRLIETHPTSKLLTGGVSLSKIGERTFSIAHEWAHHQQFITGKLSERNDMVYWNGIPISSKHYIQKLIISADKKNFIRYNSLPWELNANDQAIRFCKTYGYT